MWEKNSVSFQTAGADVGNAGRSFRPSRCRAMRPVGPSRARNVLRSLTAVPFEAHKAARSAFPELAVS